MSGNEAGLYSDVGFEMNAFSVQVSHYYSDRQPVNPLMPY